MSDDIALFENAVRRNALNFADWAGGEDAGLEDRDVVGRTVHPDSGDMVLYDARGRTGFIGICHDNWSDIHPVKIKNAKDKGYNLRLKKTPPPRTDDRADPAVPMDHTCFPGLAACRRGVLRGV